MKNGTLSKSIERRQFIARSCAVGTSLCFGCSHFFSLANAREVQAVKTYQEKIAGNSGMSYEQVYNFAFRNLLIPQLLEIANQLGKDKFIEMLKAANDKVCSKTEIIDRFYATMPKDFMNNVLDREDLEDSPDLQIFKISKCLWAKTFRDADAGDIGYAMICYGDYADAKARNATLERKTCLMQGDECCHFKWIKNG